MTLQQRLAVAWSLRFERIPANDRQELRNYGFELERDRPIAAGYNGVVFSGRCNERARRRPRSGQTEGDGTAEESLTGACVIKLAYKEKWPHQLYQEAKALEDLRHPNIVDLYLNFKSGKRRYYVLEYLNGGTLRELLSPVNANIAESEAFQMIRQLSAGLQYLHSQQVIHNDLHSGNIMVHRDGMNNAVYKIVDLGSTRQITAARDQWLVKLDMSNLASHFIGVLQKTTFQSEKLKVQLRNMFDDIHNYRIRTMDKLVEKLNSCLPEDDNPLPPQQTPESPVTLPERYRYRDLQRREQREQ